MQNHQEVLLTDLLQEIDAAATKLIETRQQLAQIHETICKAAKEGTMAIEENVTDHSIWNNYGLPFIAAKMFSDGESVYRDMLEAIVVAEESRGRLHKGLALYNMGVAQFYQRNFDEGIPNILAALEEDIKLLGPEQAKKKLADQFRQNLFGLVAQMLDSDYLNGLRKNRVTVNTATSFDIVQKLTESEFLFLL